MYEYDDQTVTYNAIYRLRMKQTKLLKRIVTGRVRFSRRTCSLEACACIRCGCVAAVFSGSPLFAARRTRMIGAYVSLRSGMPTTDTTPHETAHRLVR